MFPWLVSGTCSEVSWTILTSSFSQTVGHIFWPQWDLRTSHPGANQPHAQGLLPSITSSPPWNSIMQVWGLASPRAAEMAKWRHQEVHPEHEQWLMGERSRKEPRIPTPSSAWDAFPPSVPTQRYSSWTNDRISEAPASQFTWSAWYGISSHLPPILFVLTSLFLRSCCSGFALALHACLRLCSLRNLG